MRSPLRSPAQVEGSQGFLPQPEKDLERLSSTRLEARLPSHGSGAVRRSPRHSHGCTPTPHFFFFFFFFGVTSPVRLLSLSAHDISFLGAGSLPWSWNQWKRGNRNASRHSLGCRHPGERARPGEWDQVPAVGLRFCRAQFFSGVLLGARVD